MLPKKQKSMAVVPQPNSEESVTIDNWWTHPEKVGFAREEQRKSNLRNYEKTCMVYASCAFVKTARGLWE